jgi:tetratricopeptide (TPR) repeat protein
VLLNSCGDTSNSTNTDTAKNLAGELRDNKLYAAAIEEYQKVLDNDNVVITERANINYLIARIYFEDLQNYEQAAAYYIRAKTLNPKASFEADASRNLVTSLERLGRLVDAKRQLDQMTDIDKSPASKGDIPVARIGGVPIWLSEVERQIQALPPDVQKNFQSVEAKREFARQYVGNELLYRAAVRDNLGNDPEIKKRQEMILKNLMVEKYLLEKVIPEIKIDSLDVKNFYTANKTRYQDKPYDSVKAHVFLDYQSEKAQSAYSDYLSKLAAVEKVEFLEHNIK